MNQSPSHGQQLLATMYRQTPRTLDDLPYTKEFDDLHKEYAKAIGQPISKHDFWRTLLGERKNGHLPRKCR